MQTLILATSNIGKIAELQTMLPAFHCISQTTLGITDADETGLSFIENAIIKARHASRISNQPALADDSGLVVNALNGAPGIYSARFAGPKASNHDNIELLLSRLADVPDEKRHAYFYCAIALVQHADDPTPIVATGTFNGIINQECKGEHGFGYDPVFYLPEYQCTLAELPPEIKNTISHRAMALKQLNQFITMDGKQGKAMIDQIMAADKLRLKKLIATLSKTDMKAVEDAILTHFGMPKS